jgi:phasin family protein
LSIPRQATYVFGNALSAATSASAEGRIMATTSSGAEPLLDVRRLMSEWKLPNFDVEAIAQSQRRNIEALTQANQLALEGTQAVMRRNLELARQSMEDFQAMLSDFAKANGSMEDRIARQAEFSKKAIEKGLANFRDLTDLMTKANADAMNVLAKRVSEGFDEVRELSQKAA